MAKKVKRKNPPDATLRNVRAGKRRSRAVLGRVIKLQLQVEALEAKLDRLIAARGAVS